MILCFYSRVDEHAVRLQMVRALLMARRREQPHAALAQQELLCAH